MAGGGVDLLRARPATGAIKGDSRPGCRHQAGADGDRVGPASDGEPSIMVNAALNGQGNYGFNADNDTYGDMIEIGILDPTK